MEIGQRVYNGDRAKEILDNEVFQWAIEEIKNEVIEQWKTSPARDEAGREKLWLILSLANKLEATLRSTLETGKLAKLELDHKRTLLERVRSVTF